MKLRILLVAFFLGMLLAISLFYEPPTPTAAVACSFNNEQCVCAKENCTCGNTTIPATYCTTEDLNNGK